MKSECSKATENVKAQKGSKDIIKAVPVIHQ